MTKRRTGPRGATSDRFEKVDGDRAFRGPASDRLETREALFAETDGLRPAERHLAPWRTVEPWAGGEVPPFDLKTCVARLAKVPTTDYGWRWLWQGAGLVAPMSREEAHFWLLAFAHRKARDTPRRAAKALANGETFGRGVPSLIECVSILCAGREQGLEPMAVLTELFPAPEILHALLSPAFFGRDEKGGMDARRELLPGLRPYLLPRLSAAEVAGARAAVKARLARVVWPTDLSQVSPYEMHLAAALGMTDDIARIVGAIPDGAYRADHWTELYHRPQGLVLMLGSGERVDEELTRLGVRISQAWHLTAWLAHRGLEGLGRAQDAVAAPTGREEAGDLITVLRRADSPRMAPVMLNLMLGSKAPAAARQWLLDHPAATIRGLAGLLGRSGRTAESALDILRRVEAQAPAGLVGACRGGLPDRAWAAFVTKVVDNPEKKIPVLRDEPGWMTAGVAALDERKKKFRRPGWLDPSSLPPLVVDGHRLTTAQVDRVTEALARSTFGAVEPLVRDLKVHGAPEENDRFAWRLFETWLAFGGATKDNWAMMALGFLGGDRVALELTALVRKWPAERQHPRAVLGLSCLEQIGTDTALMQINGIAQKIRFRGLKSKAQDAMEAIAERRGMARAELEDRIVPDCGLDARGNRAFDFGARQFTFVLGHDLKPMVRDEKGKVKANLPKPGVKDDGPRATAAGEEWKVIKKQVREVTRIQALRLEQAMVTGRRWSRAELERFFVKHPLMTHLSQLVLWGRFAEGSGGPDLTFRVTEEQDLANREDEVVELGDDARVGIVHPLQVSETERTAWGEVFADYELVSPFSQLGRPIYHLEAAEADRRQLTRFAAAKVAAATLVGTLENLGWLRGMAQDAGIFSEHSKSFDAAGVTAVVEYEGVPVGMMLDWDDQAIERCFFVPGVYRADAYYAQRDERLRLGDVDPVVLSEVLSDLHTLAAKAR